MPPPTLLFLSVMNGSAWGGSEELWYKAALSCAQQDMSVGVCCYDWLEKKDKLNRLKEAGCTLYLLPGRQQLKHYLFTRKSKLKKLISSIPFEDYNKIIINQGGWKDIAYPPFENLFERIHNYSLLFHNYNKYDSLPANKRRSLQSWVNGANKNLGASSKIFEVMKETFDINVPDQGVFFNPLTIETPSFPAPYPGLINGNYQFSVMAALDIERKGQDLLISALSSEKWKQRNWELNIYGEGKDKTKLIQLVSSLQLDKKVIIHGLAENYISALRSSQLVLQITHIDAMPISVVEAMAMARPVIVSNVGDMAAWVNHNINGWVCEKVTTSQVEETLEQAWAAREKWEEFGKNSFQFFQNHFPQNPINYFLSQNNIFG